MCHLVEECIRMNIFHYSLIIYESFHLVVYIKVKKLVFRFGPLSCDSELTLSMDRHCR